MEEGTVSHWLLRGLNGKGLGFKCTVQYTALRPYLINFDATGSPCHELTSWDNSSSMSI